LRMYIIAVGLNPTVGPKSNKHNSIREILKKIL
jgi:hypothetical protein